MSQDVTVKETWTYWTKIHMSGPIEVAKQILRRLCMDDGLCVTIEPTTYIYTGGEEKGFVVGLINYPRFPISHPQDLDKRTEEIARVLLGELYQWSALIMNPSKTYYLTTRKDKE